MRPLILGKLRTAIAIAALIVATGAAGRAAELVIAHPGTPVTAIDRDSLKALFHGRKRALADGSRVEVALLAGGESHERFLRDVLETTPHQFQTHWKRLVFTGQGRMPPTLESSAAVVAYVASHPGTIAYIDAGVAHEGVKVIEVR